MEDRSPELFGLLHRVYHRYEVAMNEVFARHGIGMAAFDVLTVLLRAGPPYRARSSLLAELSLVTTGGTTLRVVRLEQAGLVERVRDDRDQRVVHVQLTPAGVAKAREVAHAHFANQAALMAELSEAERAGLAALLSRLEASLTPG